jgi:hypothetical protein
MNAPDSDLVDQGYELVFLLTVHEECLARPS